MHTCEVGFFYQIVRSIILKDAVLMCFNGPWCNFKAKHGAWNRNELIMEYSIPRKQNGQLLKQ